LAVGLKSVHGVSSHLGKVIREGEIEKSSLSIKSIQNTHSHHPCSSAIESGELGVYGKDREVFPEERLTLWNISFVKSDWENEGIRSTRINQNVGF
jgi:hypothetical protein